KKVIVALDITVNGSDKDGNPSENSERVKDAARMALEGCLARVPVAPPVEVKPIEGIPRPLEVPKEKATSLDRAKAAAEFDANVERMSSTQLLESARQTVGSREARSSAVAAHNMPH